jgi:hypothetical protein
MLQMVSKDVARRRIHVRIRTRVSGRAKVATLKCFSVAQSYLCPGC